MTWAPTSWPSGEDSVCIGRGQDTLWTYGQARERTRLIPSSARHPGPPGTNVSGGSPRRVAVPQLARSGSRASSYPSLPAGDAGTGHDGRAEGAGADSELRVARSTAAPVGRGIPRRMTRWRGWCSSGCSPACPAPVPALAGAGRHRRRDQGAVDVEVGGVADIRRSYTRGADEADEPPLGGACGSRRW